MPLNDDPLPTDFTAGAPGHVEAHEATNTRLNATAAQVDEHDTAIAGKAPTLHTHTIGNVTGLQGALDGKQASGSYATTTALASGLAGRAAASHTHVVDDLSISGDRDGTNFLRDDGVWASPTGVGDTGPAGADGRTVRSGNGAPASGLGVDGDFYIDTPGHALYGPKTGGAWGSATSLVGPTGATGSPGAAGVDGKSVRSGTGAPSSGIGTDGDFYVDRSAWVIYGPKTSGAWGSGTSLVGPQGPAGPSGGSGGGSTPDATTTTKGQAVLLGGTADAPTVPWTAVTGKPTIPTAPGDVGAQPVDADLTTIAALDAATAGALATDGSGWVRKTYAQLKTALGLTKADVGLGNVDNTSDSAKPVSTATASALALKAPLASPTFTGTARAPRFVSDPITLTATSGVITPDATASSFFRHAATADVTLAEPTGGVDGQELLVVVTASGTRSLSFAGAALPPVVILDGQRWSAVLRLDGSTWLVDDGATSTSGLAAVATSGAYGDLTGRPTIPSSKADIGLDQVDNTADANKPVPVAVTTALALKAPLASPTFTGTARAPRFVGTVVTLTATSGTIAPDASAGTVFRHDALADVALAEPTGGVDGQEIVVEVAAAGAARTLSFAGGASSVPIPSGAVWSGVLRYRSDVTRWVLTDSGSGSSSGGGTVSDATTSAKGVARILGGTADAPTVPYSSVTGTPSLAAVATSGAYADLSGRPTIPASYADLTGTVPQAALPAIALTEFLGSVSSQAAMLALTGQRGDWAYRSDLGTDWQLVAEPSTSLASWQEHHYPAGGTAGVSSVNGRSGTVTGLAEASDVTTALATKAATTVTDGHETRLVAVELPEHAATARTSADATPANLLSRTTRYDTTGGAINQTLPAATTGARLAVGWDAGSAAPTITAAGSDVIGSGSSTSFVMPLLGEVLTLRCTTSGRWRVVAGSKPQSALDARFATAAHVHAAADITSGVIAPARLGSGTRDGTRFLRDDGTWVVPSGGGSAAGYMLGQYPRTGAYLAPQCTVGTGAPTNGQMRATYVDLAAAGTADRIGIEVTTLVAASVQRLGIYYDDPTTGLPGGLLLDAGTVDTSTTGFKEITISQALGAGRWWLTASAQGTGAAGVRTNNGPNMVPYFATSEMGVAAVGVVRSAAGALPTPFAATAATTTTARVYLRFA